MSTIDGNGFNRDRFNDLRDDIASRWQSYFPNATTDERSNNGRIVSLQAELNEQAEAKIEVLLGSFDPRSAVGNQLSNLAPLMNKRRRESVKSTVTLTLTADSNGATVPAGSIVSQSAGPARFVTTSTAIIDPDGTKTVAAEATSYGPIEVLAGSLDTIATPVYGWVSVTNANAASIGRDRDVDGVLRANMLATSADAVGTPDGIYTALISIAGVTYVRVYENKTDTVNALGMPPHSVFAVVEGGADADIAAALLATVAYGIDYTDSTDIPGADWVDVDIQNPANLQTETIWFSRPVDRPIAVIIHASTDAEFPDDGQQRITDAVLELVNGWDTGRILYSSKLYVPVNSVPGIDINSITIDGTDRVTPDAFEKISLAEADLTIDLGG